MDFYDVLCIYFDLALRMGKKGKPNTLVTYWTSSLLSLKCKRGLDFPTQKYF